MDMNSKSCPNGLASGAGSIRVALLAAAKVVGAERVVMPSDNGTELTALAPEVNVGMYRAREMAGIIQPRTVEQVRRVVEIFGHSTEAGSLHPISTGRNWGLGSRQPAVDNAVLLDLGDLDRIRDIDITGGWAVIEPGVTQGR